MRKYKIGTRDSKLALIQAQLVCEALIKANPDLSMEQLELVKIKTKGDKILDKNLIDIGGKNLFIKEIEEALANGEIDFAVHSLKDMTANLHPDFSIAACLPREDPRDAFVSIKFKRFEQLPLNALIGTSSVRRKAIALHYRPDLSCIPFRGNVLTRLDKLQRAEVDATFLAVAGLKRLNIDPALYQKLEIDQFLPPVSQGIIAVECRSSDLAIYQLLRLINDLETEIVTNAERSFLEYMQADCSLPIAAYARLVAAQIHLDAQIVDDLGVIHQYNITGKAQDAAKLGVEAGQSLKKFMA